MKNELHYQKRYYRGTITEITNKLTQSPDETWRSKFLNRYGYIELYPSRTVTGLWHLFFVPDDAPFLGHINTTKATIEQNGEELIVDTRNSIYHIAISKDTDNTSISGSESTTEDTP